MRRFSTQLTLPLKTLATGLVLLAVAAASSHSQPPIPPTVLSFSNTTSPANGNVLVVANHPGIYQYGTFRFTGKFFDNGDILTDGPLSLTDIRRYKVKGAEVIERDFYIGCCGAGGPCDVNDPVYEPKQFHVYLVTPAGQNVQTLTIDVDGVTCP